MKKTKQIFIVAFLIVLLLYCCKIDHIPQSVILYQGETLNLGNFLGISLKIGDKDYNAVLASSNLNEQDCKETTVDVKLLNTFTVKEVSVHILEETTVVPIGQVSGLQLYTNGVLVVGMSEIKGEDNQKYKPYENSGIEEGDRIVKINQQEIRDTNHLMELVNQSKGESLEIEYIKENETKTCQMKPILYADGNYKLGLWVRDSSAGIGTLTFYEPSTGNFAALGHGITDSDTGDLVEIKDGEFLTTKILSIIKGLKGSPGKIQGTIEEGEKIGVIYKNSNLGVYGTVNNLSAIKMELSKEMEVARRDEITLGDATIYCNLDGTRTKEYQIEIEKIFMNNDTDNKSMLIKVKDQELLDKTGGIIQGMSGSPVIQNGKFIRSNYECLGK